MLSKFIQILYSSKWFLILQTLCYVVAVGSFCFAYSCAKGLVYDVKGTTSMYMNFRTQKELVDVEAIIQKMIDEKIGGYFYIDLGRGIYTPYNNVMLKEKKFSKNANEILLQKGVDAGVKVGENITLADKEYKVIGNSKKYNLVNYDTVEKNTLVTRVILEHKKPFSDKEEKIIDEIFSTDTAIRYFIPPRINSFAAVVKNPIFIVGIAIASLGLATLAILIFFSFSLRKRMLDVLISLEYPAKKAFGVMVVEQVITILPMFLLGLALYFILYAFMFDFLAMLTLEEIILTFCFTALLSIALTFIAFVSFWRKDNV